MKYNKHKLMDQVDMEIRNISIVTAWNIMSLFTDFNYEQKIDWLMNEYHLSDKRIEEIIKEYRNGSED
tara:strand:+ start:294 stop:497 length:204 start_codon:yes stop_codon:yes gene_type:complete